MSESRSTARAAVAFRIAQDMRSSEAAVDAAFAEVARFASGFAQARLDASLSATVDQPIYGRLIKGMTALVDARGCLVEAHEELTRVGEAIGVSRTVLHGPLDKSEPETRPQGLSLVTAG